MKLVDDSSSDEWVRVENDADPVISTAVYTPDVSITLRWGREHMQGEGWDHEPWSHVFPDKKIYGFYVELCWHGQVVHSDLLLAVDGHRAYLPAGRPVTEPDKGIVGMTVTASEAHFARLVDEISRGPRSEFDSYLGRASITVGPA
jgi:hypothetical protein